MIFNQPNSASVALNRVTRADASSIHGSLTANGDVLLDPNGVLFAPGAELSTGQRRDKCWRNLAVQMIDVRILTTDARELTLTHYTSSLGLPSDQSNT